MNEESIKSLTSKSFGLEHLLPQVADKIAEELLFNLKNIICEANAVKEKSGCSVVLPSHVDIALKRNNFSPQYGFHCDQNKPFGLVSGGGCNLSFIKESEVDLKKFVQESKVLKEPSEMQIHSHWLAVEGVIPIIPENALPSKEELKMKAIDPTNQTNEAYAKQTRNGDGKRLGIRKISAEHQTYFQNIIESAIGGNNKKQTIVIKSLSVDREVYVIVPDLCIFIKEGVLVNVAQKQLPVLMTLMKMTQALVQNEFINLSNHLHHILPSVITCIICKHLCAQQYDEDHFLLRKLAAHVLQAICKKYDTTRNNIQTRVTKIFSNALSSVADMPLVTLYGVLTGMASLGPQAFKLIVIPKIKDIGERIKDPLENPDASDLDRMEANHVKFTLLSLLVPVLGPQSDFTVYEAFGYLANQIERRMTEARADSGILFTDYWTDEKTSISKILRDEKTSDVNNANFDLPSTSGTDLNPTASYSNDNNVFKNKPSKYSQRKNPFVNSHNCFNNNHDYGSFAHFNKKG